MKLRKAGQFDSSQDKSALLVNFSTYTNILKAGYFL